MSSKSELRPPVNRKLVSDVAGPEDTRKSQGASANRRIGGLTFVMSPGLGLLLAGAELGGAFSTHFVAEADSFVNTVAPFPVVLGCRCYRLGVLGEASSESVANSNANFEVPVLSDGGYAVGAAPGWAANVSVSPMPAPGEFVAGSRTYAITVDDPLVGRLLELVLDGGISVFNPAQVNFDVVALTMEPTR